MMHTILHKAQKSVGSWIGSSVIHMGDHNVPNALMFIDKYTQIYRILLPICNTLQQIPGLAEKPALRSYIEDEFGSVDNLMREILSDFFRHGFDGSGADNFFDAGSCIDGRLTSAWNWCSMLEKKRYFHVFLLTGKFFFLPSPNQELIFSSQVSLDLMENGSILLLWVNLWVLPYDT